jgi:hypothetical protein
MLSTTIASCMETRLQCYRAYDYVYLTQEKIDYMIERTTLLIKGIASFNKYLKYFDY